MLPRTLNHRFNLLALLAWSALGCSAGAGQPSPQRVPSRATAPAEPQAHVEARCVAWPLPQGCIQSLASGPDVLCALTSTSAFCWGPGVASKSADHSPLVTLSRGAEAALGVDTKRGVHLGKSDTDPFVCEAAQDAKDLLRCGRMEGPRDRRSMRGDGSMPVVIAEIDKLASGAAHACVLTHGALSCLGYPHARGVPFARQESAQASLVDLPGAVTDVVAAGDTTCALARDELWCWGDGELFPPGKTSLHPPKAVDVQGARSDRFACVLADDGAVWCSGLDMTFSPVTALAGAAQLEPMEEQICARLASGKVACVDENGAVTERAFLAPAKKLFQGLPCALREDDSIHCDAWKHEELGEIAAADVRGIGAPRAIGSGELGGRPFACAIDAKGGLSCWGSLGFDHVEREYGRFGKHWFYEDVIDMKPVRLAGPKDLVELSRSGGCARGGDGRVWIVSPSSSKPHVHVRIAARTVKDATGAVRLERDGCLAHRADGSGFALSPDWPFVEGPVAIGPPHYEPSKPPDDDGLGAGPRFYRLHYRGETCALRTDGTIGCRWGGRGTALSGPVRDPFTWAATPVRVAPAD